VANIAEESLTLSPADLKAYYREMLFVRRFEEHCNTAYRKGLAGGYMHTYIGMEALATGWLNSIRKGYDYVITAYRDHAHAIVLGTDPVAVMAEVIGRKGGTAGGKGGSGGERGGEGGAGGGRGGAGGDGGAGGASKYTSSVGCCATVAQAAVRMPTPLAKYGTKTQP
jgi:pyruvate dehydrogenase E1 component alpha subunit